MRYYLTVLYCPQPAVQRLEVAYEVRFAHIPARESLSSLQNTLPRFPVLIEVYNGIHECLRSK